MAGSESTSSNIRSQLNDSLAEAARSADAFNVVVAFNNSAASCDAVLYAAGLCNKLGAGKYRLLVVYIVALNPKQNLPGIDHLERAFNVEIEASAEEEIQNCRSFLKKHLHGKVAYEFVAVEGEGEVGPVLEKYLREKHAEANMLVVGTRNNEGLKRWVLGSVSEYCIHNIHLPVVVVKSTSKSLSPSPSATLWAGRETNFN